MLSLIFIVSPTIFKIFSFFSLDVIFESLVILPSLQCSPLIFSFLFLKIHIIITTIIAITRTTPATITRKRGPSTKGRGVETGDVVLVVVAGVVVVDDSEMTGSTN